MATDKPSGQEKSLEMRVAELEDRLSKMHITEEEMKAYQKVSSALSMQGGAGAGMAPAALPSTSINCINCIVCIICRITCIITCRIVADCIQNPTGGGGIGGSGFGTLGM
jgi:hypothetical protein